MTECHPFERRCVDFDDNRRQVSLSDQKSKGGCKFTANNPTRKRVVCLTVDGCLMDDTRQPKCDYLLLNCTQKKAIFIELKGQNIAKAVTQLHSSIEVLYPAL